MTGLSADIDVFVQEGLSCDSTRCLAVSHNSETEKEELVFDAKAGQSYTLMVDGWEDSASAVVVEVLCEGSFPTTEDSTQDTDVEAPDSNATGPHSWNVVPINSDCSCGKQSSAFLLLLLSFTRWRSKQS
jgi:hypothetical protein